MLHHAFDPIQIALESFQEHLATVLTEVWVYATQLFKAHAADIVPRQVVDRTDEGGESKLG